MISLYFFFKQKTAYEMRISDWSSDVCSSDLLGPGRPNEVALRNPTTNALWMKKLSSGGKNWQPWEAYTNGRYLRYWSRAQKAANNPSAQPPGTGDNGSVDQAISLNPDRKSVV